MYRLSIEICLMFRPQALAFYNTYAVPITFLCYNALSRIVPVRYLVDKTNEQYLYCWRR